MPVPADIILLFRRLNERIRAAEGGPIFIPFLLRRVRLEGSQQQEEVRGLPDLVGGFRFVLGARVQWDVSNEMDFYFAFRIEMGMRLEYEGISITDGPPWGMMTPVSQKSMKSEYEPKILKVERLFNESILGALKQDY